LQDGHPLALGKGTEQTLLALLVLNAGRPLSSDAIIDALWGERPPPTAREMVRNYIGSVRRRIGTHAIETTEHGYRLNATGDAVDVLRVERLVREGHERLADGDVAQAERILHDALAMWRGRPLPELDDVVLDGGDVRRLEELRVSAYEDWLEA